MTEQELQVLTEATVGPIRDVLDRMLTVLERLSERVEVLELEQLRRSPAPAGTPKRDG